MLKIQTFCKNETTKDLFLKYQGLILGFKMILRVSINIFYLHTNLHFLNLAQRHASFGCTGGGDFSRPSKCAIFHVLLMQLI